MTEFSTKGLTPSSPIVGPDGAIWYILSKTAVGRLAPDGSQTTFSGPKVSFNQIISGSDGALYLSSGYPSGSPNQIYRLTTAGAFTLVSTLPIPEQNQISIACGSDGNIWFTAIAANKSFVIGRLMPAGKTSLFRTPWKGYIAGIAAGADGELWFANSGSHQVGRITTEGRFMSIPNVNANFVFAPGPGRTILFGTTQQTTISTVGF